MVVRLLKTADDSFEVPEVDAAAPHSMAFSLFYLKKKTVTRTLCLSTLCNVLLLPKFEEITLKKYLKVNIKLDCLDKKTRSWKLIPSLKFVRKYSFCTWLIPLTFLAALSNRLLPCSYHTMFILTYLHENLVWVGRRISASACEYVPLTAGSYFCILINEIYRYTYQLHEYCNTIIKFNSYILLAKQHDALVK